ncbi:MAG TPA: hypothetical protein VGG61_15920, partial [Gemmataceae bacterium]
MTDTLSAILRHSSPLYPIVRIYREAIEEIRGLLRPSTQFPRSEYRNSSRTFGLAIPNGRPRELSLVLSMRRENFPEKSGATATRCGIGGPGRTRTCNQAAMSDRISISFVDFTLFLVALDGVRRGSFGLILVRFSDSQHDPDRCCFRNWTR